jgi:hypothetical protein
MAVIVAHHSAIAVVHGRAVDAAAGLLTIAAAAIIAATAAGLTTTIGRTTSAPPPVSPSASGGTSGSRSNIHILFSFYKPAFSPPKGDWILLPVITAFRVMPRVAHTAQVKTNAAGNSLVNDLCPFGAPGARGRERPAREHGRWEH